MVLLFFASLPQVLQTSLLRIPAWRRHLFEARVLCLLHGDRFVARGCGR